MSYQPKHILVTGGAGFIGCHFVQYMLHHDADCTIVNLDALTYAGNKDHLPEEKRHNFVHGDICDGALVKKLLRDYQIDTIVHFAAESHVDRSIDGPGVFIQSNIQGTFILLNEAKKYWETLKESKKSNFRFIHVSTDEVYGSLSEKCAPFKETNSYQPNSPYSASKAASDHLARAWFHTYQFPVITTNCSNNYGPNQFPEKLIPLCIQNALALKPLPIYGDGSQIRDWLYVEDHCKAIITVLEKGKLGEVYNIGGWNEKTNIEVVKKLCKILDEKKPRADKKLYEELISFVKDRPGHDTRYAIDASKIYDELAWKPEETFDTGIIKTVEWYLNNQEWVQHINTGEYRKWIQRQY